MTREPARDDYPALGFDPAPGDPHTVRSLHRRLIECAKVLDDTHGVVTKLLDGSYWEGDAAVAFRERLKDGRLPKDLRNAANSLSRAARQLHHWHGELEDFRSRAKRLDVLAREAREALKAAQGRATAAGDDLDLERKGGRHDEAKKALARADGRVEDAQAELDRILGRARDLAAEHEEKAGHRAGRIRDATERLAPHEPGWFDGAMDWVEENLPDILAATAGVIGLVALLLAGPLGAGVVAALMLVCSGLSAGALGLRLSLDPELWASLKDGLTKGELDAYFWSNVVTLGGDALGALPGLGAVALGARSAGNAARSGAEVLTLGQRLSAAGIQTMEQARSISTLENPLVRYVVRGASNPEKGAKAVAATSSSIGVVTAGLGLVDSLTDADENGVKKGAATGIDGARLGLEGAGTVSLFRHALS
ncbi:putative T7SS-secreted protein [Streptomyces sp. NPDC002564]|uniref:putative T7SS-secreted protein n=1 Tax=Streptomyces sp. NPDC002564 TaxID=3364649 RepID=UPI0036AF8FEA